MPIITTNQISTTSHGISYPAASLTYTIVPGVIVAGASGFNGVFSNFHHSILANHGLVLSGDAPGVYFTSAASFSTIRNYSEGSIQGSFGIRISGQSDVIINDGDVFGTTAYGVFIDNDFNAVVVNSGHISGATGGIVTSGASTSIENTATGVVDGSVIALGDGAAIANSGLIATHLGATDGIQVTGDQAVIRNYGTGTIDGRSTGLSIDSLNGRVWNAGSITGETVDGVFAYDRNVIIENVAGGLIHGRLAGIESAGESALIINAGTVSADRSYGILLPSITFPAPVTFPPGALTHIQNDGTVFGPEVGIEVQIGQDVQIDNTGLIHSTTLGIDIVGPEVRATTITNAGAIEAGVTGVNITSQNASSVWNAGSITGDASDGVSAVVQNFVIQNVAGGVIHGAFAGIESAGDNAVIVNEGTVSASESYGIRLSHGDGTIVIPPVAVTHIQNAGTVFGPQAGIQVQTNQNVTIDNSGFVHSTTTGVEITGPDVGLTTINNLGTIEGVTASVAAGTSVVIANGTTGVLQGDVTLSDAADSIENYGAIYGNVALFGGNDTYHNRADGFASGSIDGGDGNDRLYGARANDVLLGGAGNDVVKGGMGDDVLTGGTGLDKLYGGAGADTFTYTRTNESTAVSSDIIYDFSHAEGDLIDLSQVDASSAPGIQHFTFDGTTVVTAAGHLSYSVDGSGTATLNGYFNNDATPDMVIKLAHVASLVASDFILS